MLTAGGDAHAIRHARQAQGRAAVQGLTIDAAVAAEAEAAMAAGAQQLRDGRLSEALDLFCAAAEAVPLRSRLGGESTLQRAICLDSMVRRGFGCDASLPEDACLTLGSWRRAVQPRQRLCTSRWSGTPPRASRRRRGRCCLASRCGGGFL